MKKLILVTVFTASILSANNIIVEVTNILNQNGKIAIALYNKDNDTFANISKHYKAINLEINGTKVRYIFTNIPDGRYAISVFHDENENKELDKNFLGIPKEGYGFSNNIRPKFRRASFDESKFKVNGDINITIKMGY